MWQEMHAYIKLTAQDMIWEVLLVGDSFYACVLGVDNFFLYVWCLYSKIRTFLLHTFTAGIYWARLHTCLSPHRGSIFSSLKQVQWYRHIDKKFLPHMVENKNVRLCYVYKVHVHHMSAGLYVAKEFRIVLGLLPQFPFIRAFHRRVV
jgi:hypothetical protein